eukprot:TRINITY_DN9013_c0_g1_i2.p1 TRINITY_DN9013_c0_g1~~TRINITY_DN9013_c0_g1_i2.p1  ORF type:complete len:168 (+),score=41.78 TRINITY_DN9013_c0_g1_i2:62-505(+)
MCIRDRIKAVYEKALNFIKEKNNSLVEHLLSYFGYGIGLEFKESVTLISAKSEKIVEAGMCFNVLVGANNLQTSTGKSYAIMMADTLIVGESQNEVITISVSKKYEDVSYSLSEEDDQAATNGANTVTNGPQSYPCLLYTSPSPRDS